MASLNQERTRNDYITDESRTFKKPEQTIGRPDVTDHDINDEYARNPPQNLPSNVKGSERRQPVVQEGAYEIDGGQEAEIEQRIAETEGLGRAKRLDVDNVEETSVHPNS